MKKYRYKKKGTLHYKGIGICGKMYSKSMDLRPVILILLLCGLLVYYSLELLW
ncbi:MAG: hypothetical protein PWP27_2366 [Clostridiales bacterium]|jgi:hypothetical protein|nr:hypothetical protein [Clostridiales bacterium]MDK2934556.1 hypothetical protein [Clostridiales bacterium]